MKKIIACISLVFAMSAGVTALADDTATPNDAQTDVAVSTGATYNTVLITADDYENEIVYVDQDDTGFDTATTFLMKAGTEAKYGRYTVKMGSASGDTTTMNFEIVAPDTTPEAITMTSAYTYDTKDGYYDAGFTHEGSLEGYSNLVFTAKRTVNEVEETKTAMFELPTTFTGDGVTNFAVRVVDIPNGVEVTLGVTAAEEE